MELVVAGALGVHVGDYLAAGEEGVERFLLGSEGVDLCGELLKLAALFEGELMGVVTHVILHLLLGLGGGTCCLGSLAVVEVLPGAVLAVVAGEVLHHAVAQEHKGVVNGAVHEETVVAHDYHAAVELRQVVLENLEGGDVEVVGGLVEDEEIGLAHEHHRQVEAALLATAQGGDELLLVGVGKEEHVQELRCGVMGLLVKLDILCHIAHGVDHALALVECHALLAVVAKAHRLAQLKRAAVARHLAQQQLDEGGLAHAVVTHDAQLLVAREGVLKVVEDHLVAIALAHMVGGEDFLAYVGTVHVQAHVALVAIAACTLLQVVEGVDAVLRLVLARLWLTPHPLELGAQQVARLLHLGVLRLDALGALLEVVVVVAVVGENLLLVHLNDAVAYVVEEVAVVGHHEQRHGAALQVVLEPLYHVDVEVVGGLVEDEKLGLVNQDLGERHTLDLAAAQLAHALREVVDLELGEHLLEALLIVPGVAVVHRLDGGSEGIAVATAGGALIGKHGACARVIALEACVNHRLCALKGWGLRQVAQAHVVAVDDGAAVGRVYPRQQVEQRALAGAVLSNKPHLITLVKTKGDIPKQQVVAKRLSQFFYL